MIEAYRIEPSRGKADQVGLFLKADEQMANRFRTLLWQNGFNSVRLMPSWDVAYPYFTFVSMPDSGLDKRSIQARLDGQCRAHCSTAEQQPLVVVDYETWHADFTANVQAYRAQHFLQPDVRPADAFDKGHAYELIQSGRYDEAEQYLERIANDAPLSLAPVYLIYLYHASHRPDEVVRVHTRYESLFRSSDVDRRVIEWIVQAYLSAIPPAPERALIVLDDYLPEFQRQGVSERLLAMRAQARALQGQLPDTVSDLRAYLIHTPSARLGEQCQGLLEVISGMPAPVDQISALLDELADHIEQGAHWRIQLTRSALARLDGRLTSALLFLQPVLDAPPPNLDPGRLDIVRLDAADLHLKLSQPQEAMAALELVTPRRLEPGELRSYWGMVGQVRLAAGQPELAIEALHRAYELGAQAPDLLHALARLACQAEDWSLAGQVYRDLLAAGIEPEIHDRLYTGILAWLEDDPQEAVKLLSDIPTTWDHNVWSNDALTLAHQALFDSLVAMRVPTEDLMPCISSWIDVLVAHNDLDGLSQLIDLISSLTLERITTFALLETSESLFIDHAIHRQHLAQVYVRILCAEVDASLRRGQALPTYVLDLRRGLFELDRQQFEFADEYFRDELGRARTAGLLDAEFDLEPTALPELDLSNRKITLVGGYEPVRRRVREILLHTYHLGQITEVPPSWEVNVDETRTAQSVRNSDLIVVVHRCIKHDGTDSLAAAVNGTELESRVRYAAGKGQSSIIRAVCDYFLGRGA